MTILFKDTFTDVDNTLLTSHIADINNGLAWSNNYFKIISNQAVSNGIVDAVEYIQTSYSDVNITWNIGIVDAKTRLIFRIADLSNYLFIQANTSGYTLYGRVNSNWISKASTSVIPKNGDVIKVNLNGSNIIIYVNDVNVLTYTDTFNQTSMGHGIGNGSTFGTKIDSFLIEDLSSQQSGTVYTSSLSDSILTSDSISKNLTIVVADNIKSNDTANEIKGKNQNLTDSIVLLDSISKQLNRSLSDSISTSEASDKNESKSLNDLITTSDIVNKSSQFNKQLSDSMSFLDSITTYQGRAINLYDSISIVDAISKSLNKHVNDFVSSGDSEQYVIDKTLLDVINSSDIITTNEGKSILLSDSVGLSDAINKALSQVKLDSIDTADTYTQQSQINLQLYDVIVTTDTLNVHLPNAPTLIGTIEYQGKRELNIYLQGTRQLDLNFKGVIQ